MRWVSVTRQLCLAFTVPSEHVLSGCLEGEFGFRGDLQAVLKKFGRFFYRASMPIPESGNARRHSGL